MLSSYLKKGDVVVDVGGNIGTVAIPLSRCVGPEGRVVTFEPQKLVFSILQDNITANKADNIVALNKGAGHKASMTTCPPLHCPAVN